MRNKTLSPFYNALDANIENDVTLHTFLANFQDDLIPGHLDSDHFYARVISLFNSDGMGKSRLMRNIGLKVPSFSITLESEEGKGTSVPEPDTNVCQFFTRASEEYEGQVVAAAFLSAFFHQLYIFVAKGFKVKKEISLARPSKRNWTREEHKVIYLKQLQKETSESMSKADDLINSVKCKKSLKSMILDPVYTKLRQKTEIATRNDFLDSVVVLAEALLLLECSGKDPYVDNDWSKGGKDDKPAYLEYSQLEDNLNRFLELIDATSSGTSYKLSNLAKKENQLHQFIFGIDECHYLQELLCKSEYNGSKEENPEGLDAFLRLFHDLEWSGKSENIEETGIAQSRVWLALIDSTIDMDVLAPQTKEVTMQASIGGASATKFISSWLHFGLNHPFNAKLKEAPCYVKDLTIQEMHNFHHLRLFGRGLWKAYYSVSSIIIYAISKLLCEHYWHWGNVPLLSNPEHNLENGQPWVTTLAIASFRLGLDIGKVTPEEADSFDLITESIATYLRVLNKISVDGGVVTSTPSEPMLAIAALACLNYCKSNILQWSKESSKRPGLKRFEWTESRTDEAWTNLLKEFAASILYTKTGLIQIGTAGELLGRMILTYARDCTLPDKWDFSKEKSVPYTTLGRFVESLVDDSKNSIKYSELILAKLDMVDYRLRHSLVNFNQFVHMDQPTKNEGCQSNISEPFHLKELKFAFIQGTALICPPDHQGIDHVIPILMPLKVNQTDNQDLIFEQSTTKKMGKFKLTYIGIDNKLMATGQDELAVVKTPAIKNAKGQTTERCAAMVIMMEKGTKEEFSTKRISKNIKAYVLQCNDQNYLALQIRGLNEAYPNWKSIDDSDESFQKAIHTIMAGETIK